MESIDPVPPLIAETPLVNRKRWGIHLALITFYIVGIGVMSLFGRDSDHPALSHKALGVVIVSVVELCVFGLFLGLACFASKPTRDDLLLRWRKGPLPIALGVAYSIGLRLATGIVVGIIAAVLILTGVVSKDALGDYVNKNQPRVDKVVDISALNDHSAYFWLSITLVCFVVAGLREELWRSAFLAGMRKVWPHYFSSTMGQVWAVMVGAVIFGAAHLTMGPIAAFAAGVLGVGLGLIMVLHRSIWPAVIAHGCFDATSMVFLPWAMEMMKHLPKTF